MTAWTDPSTVPGYGALFEAGLGAGARLFPGANAAGTATAVSIPFTAPHGLVAGQAVAYGGEIRFVAAVADPLTVLLNAPFSTTPGPGAMIGPTITYALANELKSASIFDYWSPSSALQRILCGAAVNKLSIQVNGDYHEFQFSGIAQDVIDNVSFTNGSGQLTSFPAEPALGTFDYTIIPGNLGQAWIGSTPNQLLTLTTATIEVDNSLDLRDKEFGSALAQAISPGKRKVQVNFDIFEQDDDATKELYQAARQQSPITAMLQLGQAAGQLFGIYLKSVVPEVPEFDDTDKRLQWKFSNARAQGTVDDEIVVAFA
jgi:hypothetical protein